MATIEVSQARGRVPVTVLHVQERINLGTYKELEKAAQEAYENGTRDIIIDLAKSESLTSIGIRALITIYKLLAEGNEKHLKLAGVSPAIQDMLQIAGINQYIEIYDTVDEALASY